MKLRFATLSIVAGIACIQLGCMGCRDENKQPAQTESAPAPAQRQTPASAPAKVNVTTEPVYYQDKPLTDLYKLDLYLGEETLNAELALTVKQISTGMMYRTELAESAGMLFVYPFVSDVAFYMKNTTIPLSCAYIDPEGVILEIYDLQPLNEESVPSKSSNIRYILEVNQGWFQRHNIGPGTLISTERGSLPELFPLEQ